MTIQVLGAGCTKCQMLETSAIQALEETGINAEIEKVTSMNKISEMGVLVTPALAIDGVVKSAGKVLTVKEMSRLLMDEAGI
ncbi:MAG: thioredoxin family protein [Spirochaetales bacterium]|nr:thioredoxin family protein [Spirochaetales bacterium]